MASVIIGGIKACGSMRSGVIKATMAAAEKGNGVK